MGKLALEERLRGLVVVLALGAPAAWAAVPPEPACPPALVASALSASAPRGVSMELDGAYQVGRAQASVRPVRMAYELRWKRGRGAMTFFLEGRARDSLDVFAAEVSPGKSDRFYFKAGDYRVGLFVRADGVCMPVLKVGRRRGG